MIKLISTAITMIVTISAFCYYTYIDNYIGMLACIAIILAEYNLYLAYQRTHDLYRKIRKDYMDGDDVAKALKVIAAKLGEHNGHIHELRKEREQLRDEAKRTGVPSLRLLTKDTEELS